MRRRFHRPCSHALDAHPSCLRLGRVTPFAPIHGLDGFIHLSKAIHDPHHRNAARHRTPRRPRRRPRAAPDDSGDPRDAHASHARRSHPRRCAASEARPPGVLPADRCHAPSAAAPSEAPAKQAHLAFNLDSLEPLQPSGYLVHFYSHDIGDLERGEFTESLAAAAQLIRQHLAERPQPVWQVTHDPGSGELTFLTNEDVCLASIRPYEPKTPDVEAPVAEACTALAAGDLTALRRLFVAPARARPQPLIA